MGDFEQALHSEALNQKAPHETRVNDFEDGARWANARIAALLRPVVFDLDNWAEVLTLGGRHEEAAVVSSWSLLIEEASAEEGRDEK